MLLKTCKIIQSHKPLLGAMASMSFSSGGNKPSKSPFNIDIGSATS
jgi:hypothetical protein